jgi:mRNA interferase MazF
MIQRGDIVLCRFDGPYSSKPRPAVVVQSDEIAETFQSVTLCPITSCFVENADSFRISVKPGKYNQLQKPSYVMVDKISTYPKESICLTSGKLSSAMMAKVDEALLNWLQLK